MGEGARGANDATGALVVDARRLRIFYACLGLHSRRRRETQRVPLCLNAFGLAK